MPKRDIEILKLLSVALTREKQLVIREEFERYHMGTNWVIKIIVKNHLTSLVKIQEIIQDEFFEKYDKRPVYLENVIKTAISEIATHRRLAVNVRSMRDKIPFFKFGRMILSQPIIKIDDRTITLKLQDRTEVPIPYDKRSRNSFASQIAEILKGEPRGSVIDGKPPVNGRYGRVRLTWNNEGFLGIDIRASLPERNTSDLD
ncbi:MAG: hypothetical protein JW779_07050 [Candidatus Thorarchaeota archaeon]|nr:hypothetical protein [Candidatus Thorarchaeota archaeon]